MYKSAHLICVLLLFSFASAFSSESYWIKHFGGKEHDSANVRLTEDGGYIAYGYIQDKTAFPVTDIFVQKYSPVGLLEWQWRYGGSGSENSLNLELTSDGGYILACKTESFLDSLGDILVLKLMPTGEIEWQYTFGGTKGDGPSEIVQTEDGGYIVSAYTRSYGWGHHIRSWLIKLSSSGKIEWQRLYGEGTNGNALIPTSGGGYLVAGERWPMYGRPDVWIMKLSDSGEIVWERTYGDDISERASSIVQTIDGGYIVAGNKWKYLSLSREYVGDIWILKFSEGGEIEWQRTYGGPKEEKTYSIQQISDGSYIVSGRTDSFGNGKQDALLIKLSTAGDIEWQKTYGDLDFDSAFSTQELPDIGYLVSGIFTPPFLGEITNALMMKLNSNGDVGVFCDLISIPKITVSDTFVIPKTITSPVEDTEFIPTITDIVPQNIFFTSSFLCGTDRKKGIIRR